MINISVHTMHFRRMTVFSHSWKIQVIMIIICSLFARTLTYNYDFSLSVKENAFNYHLHHKPVRRQPITTKKPRSLSDIVLYRTQQTQDLQQYSPLQSRLFPLVPLSMQELSSQTAKRYYGTSTMLDLPPPDDLCILNTTFRI
jgi:hypothetical protein